MVIDTSKLNHGDYTFLYKIFDKKIIESRFETIYSFLEDFINNRNIADKVIISRDLVYNAVLDYFTDISRIKKFQDIEKVNSAKIYAYSSYWLLRRKPIQIKEEYTSDELSFINEEMVTTYIFGYLFDVNTFIVKSEQDNFDEFEKNVLYSFIYRNYTPQTIESLIYAFQAGKAYQYSVDYSDSFNK